MRRHHSPAATLAGLEARMAAPPLPAPREICTLRSIEILVTICKLQAARQHD